MAAAPSFPTYKWWETDDKTKRLYTELLAEKLSSPRKSGSTNLSRKPSNGKDTKSQLTSSPKHDIPKVNFSCGERNSRKSKEEKGEREDKSGKYTFETITIDTLAKYEYIKSPRKRAASTVPVSFFESTEKPDSKEVIKAATSGYKDNKEVIEKLLPTSKESKEDKPTQFSNGQFLISQKFASTKNELQGLKNESDEKDASKNGPLMKKDKPSQAKLVEIPEYTSSESSESSADETVLLGASNAKKTVTPLKSKEPQDNKKTGEVDKPLKIEELSTKFQFLSEEVAQLEFKMFEFSDDIKKLKQAMGFKDTKPENYEKEKTSTKQPTVVKTNEFGITRSKSFTHADKFNSKALLMKQNASPSKMLAAKTGGLLSEKLPLEGTSKEDAMAELKKNGALTEIINKIKEQEFSEDEIQEILRCAKDKYVNKPQWKN
ncbi:uncharacterized protein LOC111328935 [Stylophora pistillata]|nr:uncharacterized protein LOC111328935 [Stylophora pistillata]